MVVFTDFKKLEKYILQQMNKATQSTSVEDIFKEAMVESVQEEVYDKYEPHKYKRRKTKDGLIDENNMYFTSTSINGKEISSEFENLTLGVDSMKDNYISELIEDGSNNILTTSGNSENGWYKLGVWSEPRPFAKETAEKLNSGSHNSKLKSALEKEINR